MTRRILRHDRFLATHTPAFRRLYAPRSRSRPSPTRSTMVPTWQPISFRSLLKLSRLRESRKSAGLPPMLSRGKMLAYFPGSCPEGSEEYGQEWPRHSVRLLGVGMPKIHQACGRIHSKIGTASRSKLVYGHTQGMVKSAVHPKSGGVNKKVPSIKRTTGV
jgi:hypothetical protein